MIALNAGQHAVLSDLVGQVLTGRPVTLTDVDRTFLIGVRAKLESNTPAEAEAGAPVPDWQAVAKRNKEEADYWRGQAMGAAATAVRARREPSICTKRESGIHHYACVTCGHKPEPWE